MADKRVTYFVVAGFKPQKGKRAGLVADQPLQVASGDVAKRRAQRIADAGGAAIAFSRSGDPSSGDWEDAVILGKFGTIPDEVVERISEAA